MMKFVNESICWHGTGKISSCSNRILQEVVGFIYISVLVSTLHLTLVLIDSDVSLMLW